jgi:DNA-binding PucR family transcriptional regulator
LEGSTHRARRQLAETLRSWTASRENVAVTAATLRLHPQTVRYRLKRLRNLLGAAVEDSDWLLATQLGFRAVEAHRGLGRGQSR